MVSSRRKGTAAKTKFQTELVIGHCGIRAVPCGAADSAFSDADNACAARNARDRQKDTCVATREIMNAPRASVLPA